MVHERRHGPAASPCSLGRNIPSPYPNNDETGTARSTLAAQLSPRGEVEVASWLAITIPAVILALLVRLDARFIGPYFALSELVPGFEGLDAVWWYRSRVTRHALFRRIVYPALVAFVLALVDYGIADVLAVAGMGAGLLLWPVVFHGLPRGVSRRDWEVPAIHVLFVLSFIASGALGFYVLEVMRILGDGSASDFVIQNGVTALVWGAIVVIATSFWEPFLGRLRTKRENRAERAKGIGYEGNPADLASGDLDESAK